MEYTFGMASQFDDTDFVDRDFQQSKEAPAGSRDEPAKQSPQPSNPLPTRKDLEAKVGDTQMRLAELKRQQEELERQRVALEEVRRRRKEFHDGKTEMQKHLTRGTSLLEEAASSAQRDAAQMNKTLINFRQALEKVSSFSEESWTAENMEVELTRALAAIENARMEWNAARLKWSFLNGKKSPAQPKATAAGNSESTLASLANLPFSQLCRLGFALTWPLTAVVGLTVLLALWLLKS